MCAICMVVILVVGAGLSVPNRNDYQYKRMFAVPIAVDHFLKQIGFTQNISEPAETFFRKQPVGSSLETHPKNVRPQQS